MWDGGDADEVMAVSHSIKTSSDWASTMEQLAEKAHAEGRTVNEIAYLRMSEFFIYGTDQKKKKRYQEACDLFYDYYSEYFDKGIVQRHKVTYCGGYLSVMVTKAKGSCKGGILLHGSNDSYYLVHPLVDILRPVRLHLTKTDQAGCWLVNIHRFFYAVIWEWMYLFHEEYDMLQNASLLTLRLLTDKQNVGTHCDVGNSKLVLDSIIKWIECCTE